MTCVLTAFVECREERPVTELTQHDEIIVRRPPQDLYAMVSDVTRMGEWSPECTTCAWEGPERGEGAYFLGTNHGPQRAEDWTTRCEVVAARPPSEFAFVVEVTGVRWAYGFEPVEEGTRVTETWTFPATSRAIFEGWYGDQVDAQIELRTAHAKTGIAATLAAVKAVAEAATPS